MHASNEILTIDAEILKNLSDIAHKTLSTLFKQPEATVFVENVIQAYNVFSEMETIFNKTKYRTLLKLITNIKDQITTFARNYVHDNMYNTVDLTAFEVHSLRGLKKVISGGKPQS